MKQYEILEYEIPNDTDSLKPKLNTEFLNKKEVKQILKKYNYEYDESCDIYILFNNNNDEIIQLRGI